MGIEALITLATQIGGATGSALTGGGFSTAAASTAANAAAYGATGAIGTAAASTGILGTGIGVGVGATQLGSLAATAGSIASLPKTPKNLQTKDKEIKTNVGDDVSGTGRSKRRSVASTVQGGNKRNSLS